MSEQKRYSLGELSKFEKMSEEELAEYPGAKEQLQEVREIARQVVEKARGSIGGLGKALAASSNLPKLNLPKNKFSELTKHPPVVTGIANLTKERNPLDYAKTVRLHPDTINALAKAIAREMKA